MKSPNEISSEDTQYLEDWRECYIKIIADGIGGGN
jgi:hypothetical protein